MPHPKDNEVYPIGSVVQSLKDGYTYVIVDHGFLMGGNNFLNYYGESEERSPKGPYAIYHDDLILIKKTG